MEMNKDQNAMDLFILGDLLRRYCRSEPGVISTVVNGMDSNSARKKGTNQTSEVGGIPPLVCETIAISCNAAPTRNPSSSGDFFGLILYWQR